MRVFVINLAKNKQRMDLIDKRLSSLDVRYERQEAVYGKDVPLKVKAQNTNRFWWWCIKGYPMRDGEYGCAMSHLNVYRRMVAENLPVACILEDDAIPREALPKLLDWLSNHMDLERPQVALISNHRDQVVSTDYLLQRVSTGSFTDGYVITLPAAKKILEKNLPIKCPSDTWTFWCRKGWIELYQAYPEGVNQEWDTTEGYSSDVTASGDFVLDVRKMSAASRVLWKVKRVIGLTLARFLI